MTKSGMIRQLKNREIKPGRNRALPISLLKLPYQRGFISSSSAGGDNMLPLAIILVAGIAIHLQFLCLKTVLIHLCDDILSACSDRKNLTLPDFTR